VFFQAGDGIRDFHVTGVQTCALPIFLQDLGESTKKARDALKRELSKLRTGRAHPWMLDGIRVDYYGQMTPIAQMATVSVPEPRRSEERRGGQGWRQRARPARR